MLTECGKAGNVDSVPFPGAFPLWPFRSKYEQLEERIEKLSQALQRLDSAQRLLQGRLNQIAPPRASQAIPERDNDVRHPGVPEVEALWGWKAGKGRV